MNKFFKRISIMMLAASLMLAPAVPANAMTKKQVNSEITKLQKKVKSDKAAYNKALKNDQNTLATYTQIDGVVYNPDPYIVQVTRSDDRGNPYNIYYHFTDKKNLTEVQDTAYGKTKVTGYATLSGKLFDFYGTKAVEATAVEAPHTASDKQAAITKNQSRIKSLKNSKKESISLDPTYTITTGQSLTLTPVFKYNTSDINKITWKSKNTKVVKVSKKGKLLGIAPGTTTITAKLSVTGKKYKTTVNVIAG